MQRDILDAVDEAGTIRICLEAVADLMSTDDDAICRSQRGNIGMLLGYLNDRLGEVHGRIWDASKAMQSAGEVPHA